MSLFKSVSIIRRSVSPGMNVKGKWVKGEMVDTPFMGTVQPPSGRTLQALPEGKRTSDIIQVYAPIQLEFITTEPQLNRDGDILIWDEKQYEVFQAKKWSNSLLPHWELLAERKKEGTL